MVFAKVNTRERTASIFLNRKFLVPYAVIVSFLGQTPCFVFLGLSSHSEFNAVITSGRSREDSAELVGQAKVLLLPGLVGNDGLTFWPC